MTHAQELASYVRTQMGPDVRVIHDRTARCALCRADLTPIPLASRLLLMVATVEPGAFIAGALCEPCWGDVNWKYPGDIKGPEREPRKRVTDEQTG